MEEDASLFTSNTTTSCDYNITNGVQNSDTISEGKSKIISPMGIHLQNKHKYNMSLVILTYNTMTSIMVMHSFLKTSTHHYYNKNYKTCTGAYMTPSQPKVIKYPQKWMFRQCHTQCIFQVVLRHLLKLIMSHTKQ